MHTRESLLRTSSRAFIAAGTIGIACAALILNVLWERIPQHALHGPDGIAWVTPGLIALIVFILGAGASLTVYFAFNLLRISLTELNRPGKEDQHGP